MFTINKKAYIQDNTLSSVVKKRLLGYVLLISKY